MHHCADHCADRVEPIQQKSRAMMHLIWQVLR